MQLGIYLEGVHAHGVMRMIPLHGILAEKGCHSVIQRLLLGTKGLEKEKGEKENYAVFHGDGCDQTVHGKQDENPSTPTDEP